MQVAMKQCLLCRQPYRGRKSLCPHYWTEERQKALAQVKYNNARARAKGVEASLTLGEWLTTLDHFNWLCAYCQKAPCQALDHFIPFNSRNTPINTIHKGTQADNCVPSCKICNSRKHDSSPERLLKTYKELKLPNYHPSLVRPSADYFFPSEEAILRIAAYLGINFDSIKIEVNWWNIEQDEFFLCQKIAPKTT